MECKLKLKNPRVKIGVIGCVAQAEGKEIIERSKIVDMVLGPQVYHRLPNIIKKIENNEKVIDTDFPIEDKFEKLNLNTDLPFSEEISKKFMLLPMNTSLETEDIEYICDLIKKYNVS